MNLLKYWCHLLVYVAKLASVLHILSIWTFICLEILYNDTFLTTLRFVSCRIVILQNIKFVPLFIPNFWFHGFHQLFVKRCITVRKRYCKHYSDTSCYGPVSSSLLLSLYKSHLYNYILVIIDNTQRTPYYHYTSYYNGYALTKSF